MAKSSYHNSILSHINDHENSYKVSLKIEMHITGKKNNNHRGMLSVLGGYSNDNNADKNYTSALH